MIDLDVKIDDGKFKASMEATGFITSRLLIDAIDDISTEVQQRAQEIAPIGEGWNPEDVPGTLARHGILKSPTNRKFIQGSLGAPGSFVDPEAPAIGGGFSVRGGNPLNTGQFSKRPAGFGDRPGHVFSGEGSRTVVESQVLLNPAVKHAKWVHEGTGIYGPHHHPIVPVFAKYLRFRYKGRRFAKESVKGQKPQPFLTEAYVYVNNVYTPARLSELRAQLAATI